MADNGYIWSFQGSTNERINETDGYLTLNVGGRVIAFEGNDTLKDMRNHRISGLLVDITETPDAGSKTSIKYQCSISASTTKGMKSIEFETINYFSDEGLAAIQTKFSGQYRAHAK